VGPARSEGTVDVGSECCSQDGYVMVLEITSPARTCEAKGFGYFLQKARVTFPHGCLYYECEKLSAMPRLQIGVMIQPCVQRVDLKCSQGIGSKQNAGCCFSKNTCGFDLLVK
jgi:hypothetical protein